jgi:hypothetical protein
VASRLNRSCVRSSSGSSRAPSSWCSCPARLRFRGPSYAATWALRLATATPDEVRTVTGCGPGTVSPFGLACPLRLVADRWLLEQDVLSLGAGIPNPGVILRRDDPLRALDPEWGDFQDQGATSDDQRLGSLDT